MSTTHQIWIEDYLVTGYRPDRDYVDCSVIDWEPVDNFDITGTQVHVALENLWQKLAEMRSFR